MPVTASGTAYTVYSNTTTGYGTAYYAVADEAKNNSNIPTILYTHGAQGAANQFAATPAWQGLRDWLIDNGCAWIEGGGGITDAEGSQGWGNKNSQLAYVADVGWVDTQIDIGPFAILGRSMGGLVAVWLYLLSSLAPRCSGLIISSGIQTLTYGELNSIVLNPEYPNKGPNEPEHVNYPPRLSRRPTGQYFSPRVLEAYGATDFANFSTLSHDYDPMNFAPSLWDGKKVLQLVGDKDYTATPEIRGAYPLRELYAGRPAVDLLDVRIGGDHTGTNGSYLQLAPMTEFLSDLGFGTAVEVPDPVGYSIESLWRVTGHGILTKLELEVPHH